MADTAEALHSVELICARLCHDLGGIAGTLVSALDMVRTEAPVASEALALAHDAAAELAARLNLLRAAWGPVGDAITLGELHAMMPGLPNAQRIVVDTSGMAQGAVFSPVIARILLNLMLLAQEGLPRGGTIRLVGSSDDLLVHNEGERACWPPLLARCLAGEAAATALAEPRTMQAPLAALLARAAGIPLTITLPIGLGKALPPLRLGGR